MPQAGYIIYYASYDKRVSASTLASVASGFNPVYIKVVDAKCHQTDKLYIPELIKQKQHSSGIYDRKHRSKMRYCLTRQD